MAASPDEVLRVREQADCLADTVAVRGAYDALAARLTADYAQRNPLVLTVVVGGMIPSAEIVSRLDFPLELDYLHATRYRGATSGGGLEWRRRIDPLRLRGRHVLVIDDVLDEGHTLAAVLAELRAGNPASLATAVLVEKDVERDCDAVSADYVGLHLPNRYLFGCGMDYKDHWRQLPAIYAVGETASEGKA